MVQRRDMTLDVDIPPGPLTGACRCPQRGHVMLVPLLKTVTSLVCVVENVEQPGVARAKPTKILTELSSYAWVLGWLRQWRFQCLCLGNSSVGIGSQMAGTLRVDLR